MRIEQFRQLQTPGMNSGQQQRRVVDYPASSPLPAFSAVLEDQDTPLSGWADVDVAVDEDEGSILHGEGE